MLPLTSPGSLEQAGPVYKKPYYHSKRMRNQFCSFLETEKGKAFTGRWLPQCHQSCTNSPAGFSHNRRNGLRKMHSSYRDGQLQHKAHIVEACLQFPSCKGSCRAFQEMLCICLFYHIFLPGSSRNKYTSKAR